jgi:RNA polymerase sigma-70 factor (ECF subfamily)
MNREPASERELIECTRRGECDAYGELVRRHQTVVYNIAYRLVGERQAALDLAQETFVHAYQALASFDATRPFAPWIRRIATNLALNWLERNRVSLVSLESEAEDISSPDHSCEPERAYLELEQTDVVRRAILSLSLRQRAMIELRHFQELSYQDISATLHLPLSDVKSDLFRARQRLRAYLEGRL